MKKIISVCLALFVVVAMVLASCKTPTTTTGTGTSVTGTATQQPTTKPIEQQPSPPPTPSASREPKYGGTITFLSGQTGGFDPANHLNFWPSALMSYEGLVAEDWTKGPSGTREIALASNYTPPEYIIGWLAESWKIDDLYNITYFLRKGIHFMNKPPVNGREVTSADVVYVADRYQKTPTASQYQTDPAKQFKVVAIDKYTVKFTVVNPNPNIVLIGYSNFQIYPRELVDTYGDLTNWRNMNTTGPFYVTDVVPDSSVTLSKNPDYWQVDPFRPQNHLPYVDKVKALVILDTATALAALRAGKVDRLGLSKEQATSMIKTNPELKYRRLAPSLTNIIHMRTDLKDQPYANKLVRQALSIAIDRQSIIKDYYGGDAEILNWPFQTTAGPNLYTPFDKLPANLQEIYTYNTTKAKQMLKDAGYPNGFKLKIQLLAGYAGGVEVYSIVKSYWDAIGVETTLDVLEAGAYWSVLVGHTYKDMTVSAWGNSAPAGGLAANTSGYLYNYSVVSDKANVDDPLIEANKIIDPVQRAAAYKKIGLYLIEQQYYIEMPSPYGYVFWQPWLLGQNGEIAHGVVNNWYGYIKFSWIDKTAK